MQCSPVRSRVTCLYDFPSRNECTKRKSVETSMPQITERRRYKSEYQSRHLIVDIWLSCVDVWYMYWPTRTSGSSKSRFKPYSGTLHTGAKIQYLQGIYLGTNRCNTNGNALNLVHRVSWNEPWDRVSAERSGTSLFLVVHAEQKKQTRLPARRELLNRRCNSVLLREIYELCLQ